MFSDMNSGLNGVTASTQKTKEITQIIREVMTNSLQSTIQVNNAPYSYR